MKLITSETADPNYLATVVSLKNIRPHSNADKLQLVTIFGNQVIISKDNSEGEKMVYFPIESAINAEYLSWANMFSTASLNADGKTKGYFGDKRRVKPTRLRGEISNGIVISVKNLVQFLNAKYDYSASFKEEDFIEGESFDVIQVSGNTTLVLLEKYIPKVTKQGEAKEPRDKKEKELGVTKLLLPNQFRFHGKTTQLGRAIHTVRPDDHVSVSSKLHGTSAVFGNLLCKVPLTWKDKIAKFFGIRVVEEEYRFIYSSRNTIKNRKDGEYSSDVWGQWAEALEPKLPAGFTLYGEIVGYTANGRAIQKNYAYGLPILQNQFYVYRVTYTDKLGQVLEFDWQQIGDFCGKYNLERVPTYYHGKAADLFDIDSEAEDWGDQFFKNLEETYLEKPCELCNTGIVREGICLRRENSDHKNAWKLKSFSFLQAESADRDAGETNMEEEEG